jgi:hypothetical protein
MPLSQHNLQKAVHELPVEEARPVIAALFDRLRDSFLQGD